MNGKIDRVVIRKYTDKERLNTYGRCYDCGLPYADFPCDAIVDDALWERITPTSRKGGGLLCPNCICARLMELGGSCVWIFPGDDTETNKPIGLPSHLLEKGPLKVTKGWSE